MSTRAYFAFRDRWTSGVEEYFVYMHGDGYPENVIPCLEKTFPFSKMKTRDGINGWESSEFAAAFVAANKLSGGGWIYLSDGVDYSDGDWCYELEKKDNVLHIMVHHFKKELYDGSYDELLSKGIDQLSKLLNPTET